MMKRSRKTKRGRWPQVLPKYGYGSELPQVARLAGLEPATAGLEVRCSIQLSYRRLLPPKRWERKALLFITRLGYKRGVGLYTRAGRSVSRPPRQRQVKKG